MTVIDNMFGPVNGSRGAPMGRSEWKPEFQADYALARKFYLRKATMVDGDYDQGGAYWGMGEPLYCAYSEAVWLESEERDAGPVRMYFRASSRSEAKAIVRERFTKASFFN